MIDVKYVINLMKRLNIVAFAVYGTAVSNVIRCIKKTNQNVYSDFMIYLSLQCGLNYYGSHF